MRRTATSGRALCGQLAIATGLSMVLATCSAKPDSRRASNIPPPPLPPVQVTAVKTFSGGTWSYGYIVRNGSAFPIGAIEIGFNGLSNEAELTLRPLGWEADAGIPASSVASPAGWQALYTAGVEGDSTGTLRWEVIDTNHDILGGQTQSSFLVRVSEEDSLYEVAHWTVYLSLGSSGYYTGALEPEGITGAAYDVMERRGDIQITPQPTSGGAKIGFDLPTRARVRVEIFDVQGRFVRGFPAADLAAGSRSVEWDGRDGTNKPSPAGVYFVRVMYGKVERFGRLVISR